MESRARFGGIVGGGAKRCASGSSYHAWGELLQKNVIGGTAESMTLAINNKNEVTTPAFTYDAAGNVTWILSMH